MRNSIVLCGLLAATPGWAASPDLVPRPLALDPQNRLMVSFANEGDGEVPAGVGRLSIHIDGRAVGSYSFPILADQSFRAPGGNLTIPTNFRLGGARRRVSVFVDSGGEIVESNELQNTLSRTIDPPALTGPDFVVSDLYLSSGMLRLRVANRGTAASPEGLAVRIRVIVDGGVAADLTPVLPSIVPGFSYVVVPSPEIPVPAASRVRALLNMNHFLDDLDSTNNVREELLPSGPSLSPYLDLLAEPRIAANVAWANASGTRRYADWTAGERSALHSAILREERGDPQVPAAPPARQADGHLSAADAWNVYLAHVAHALWVEHHRVVAWRLLDLTDAQLALLLDGRRLLSYTTSGTYSTSGTGNVTPWNPRISYEFLQNLRLIRATPLDTLHALTDWMRAHLIHTLGTDDFSVLFGYDGPPPADRVLYALQGQRHKTAGCWGTTGVYGAVLRGVNIPVERGTITLGGGTHARPVFPSLDRSMPHGDDPYTSTLSPSGANVPVFRLFYTLAQMNARFLAPVVDCSPSGCNTLGEQASYNKSKDHQKAANDVLGDGLLYQYARYGAVYLDDSLRGSRIGGEVVEYARPFFTSTERAAMVGTVETRVRELGGGDLEAGKTFVLDRWYRFGANK